MGILERSRTLVSSRAFLTISMSLGKAVGGTGAEATCSDCGKVPCWTEWRRASPSSCSETGGDIGFKERLSYPGVKIFNIICRPREYVTCSCASPGGLSGLQKEETWGRWSKRQPCGKPPAHQFTPLLHFLGKLGHLTPRPTTHLPTVHLGP